MDGINVYVTRHPSIGNHVRVSPMEGKGEPIVFRKVKDFRWKKV
jgi:hypothetical protein